MNKYEFDEFSILMKTERELLWETIGTIYDLKEETYIEFQEKLYKKAFYLWEHCSSARKVIKHDDTETDLTKRFYGIGSIRRREREGLYPPPEGVCGVYLLGTVNANPFTDEKFYWVKVGVTKQQFKQRLNAYDTHSPMYYPIDYADMEEMPEEYCHKELSKIAIELAPRCTEWFRVDRETYIEISNKGFEFFREKRG